MGRALTAGLAYFAVMLGIGFVLGTIRVCSSCRISANRSRAPKQPFLASPRMAA
jgi:hypothetical protein